MKCFPTVTLFIPVFRQVFKRIKEVANSDIVKKVDATYLFNIEESGKYFVDLKNGEGTVIEGDAPATPDVTIDINDANILRLFNRKSRLSPHVWFKNRPYLSLKEN